MPDWKVSFEDLELKRDRRPFFKLSSIVSASSRKEAIEEVRAKFSPPQYGNYRASKLKNKKDKQSFISW